MGRGEIVPDFGVPRGICRCKGVIMDAMTIMRMAGKCKSRRYARLLRGKFRKVVGHLSDGLYDSAMREFDRALPERMGY